MVRHVPPADNAFLTDPMATQLVLVVAAKVCCIAWISVASCSSIIFCTVKLHIVWLYATAPSAAWEWD